MQKENEEKHSEEVCEKLVNSCKEFLKNQTANLISSASSPSFFIDLETTPKVKPKSPKPQKPQDCPAGTVSLPDGECSPPF